MFTSGLYFVIMYSESEDLSMSFPERIKALRTKKGLTQLELGQAMGVSNVTVGQWEAGKREANFEMLCQLSDFFDRRIDYLLGHSEDASSVKLSQEDIYELGRMTVEEELHQTIQKYLRLDNYGKQTVNAVILSEYLRCHEQELPLPQENFEVTIRLK